MLSKHFPGWWCVSLDSGIKRSRSTNLFLSEVYVVGDPIVVDYVATKIVRCVLVVVEDDLHVSEYCKRRTKHATCAPASGSARYSTIGVPLWRAYERMGRDAREYMVPLAGCCGLVHSLTVLETSGRQSAANVAESLLIRQQPSVKTGADSPRAA